jgi:hypothetical protein
MSPDEIPDTRPIPETGPPEPAAAEAPTEPFPPRADPAGRRAEVPGYRIVGDLGRGGMGVVYRATQLGLNRTVALKMILAGGHAGPNELARFRAEAEAIARLQHPNIVQIHEIGHHDGLPYIALEYCPNGSLARRLAAGPLPPGEAAALVEALARAMDAAHRAAIVHRDLKPANVLLAADGTPKVTDFGLAKRVDGESGLTASGVVMGTPSYMAPEQARGEVRSIGPAADVYALGVILYECLAGRPPFRADTAHDTIGLVLASEPEPPSRHVARLPRDLETICLKCLQKDPARRYATAAGLADDLRRFQVGEPIHARPIGRLGRAWRRVRRRPGQAVLVLAVAGLALAVLALALGRRGDRPTAPSPSPAAAGEELREVVAELDRTDPGWRLEQIEEARAKVPPERNSAPRIAAANRLLPEGWDKRVRPDPAKPWLRDQFVAGVPPDRSLREALNAPLEGTGPALAEARAVADLPEGRSPISYSRDGLSTRLVHTQDSRPVARVLGLDALRRAIDDGADAGLESCRAEVHVGRSLRDEPFLFSQLVRYSTVLAGLRDAEWVLGQGVAGEPALAALQRTLQSEASEPTHLIGVRGERGELHWFMSAATIGDLDPSKFGPDQNDKSLGRSLKAMGTGPGARRAHAQVLRYMNRLVAVARLPDHQRLAAGQEWERLRESAPDVVRALLGSGLGGHFLNAYLRHRAATRSADAALAAERFRLRAGRWPATLGELVPDLLPEVPADPYDGAPLRYRRLPDGVVVYSISEDGRDDGGTHDLGKPSAPEFNPDVGFRLWDAPLRGRPKPADRPVR